MGRGERPGATLVLLRQPLPRMVGAGNNGKGAGLTDSCMVQTLKMISIREATSIPKSFRPIG